MIVEETRDKRYWHDGCNHGINDYIGSVRVTELLNGQVQESKFDVYAFPDSFNGQHVCIRYGNRDNEYYSPGPIKTLISTTDRMTPYKAALHVIEEKGHIVFRKKL